MSGKLRAIPEEESEIVSTTASDVRPSTNVSIGVLIGLDDSGVPLVIYNASPSDIGVPARSTTPLTADDIGCEIALLFEDGDVSRPLIIGRIQDRVNEKPQKVVAPPKEILKDGERLIFEAEEEITLRCGKSSITLTKAGKVLIRGSYILSRSTGSNRIKGGSIQLN